ncbi:MAG TPA: efflux RND transporter periplasmic adaptor subunit [Syntrophomonadaceae bacterium]|nr:efflux RND transporter periplasmic adaptor subunit [Syntrophomonadaceae bacterium]
MKRKLLIGIVALVVVVAAVILVLNPPATKVKLHEVTKGNIQQSVDETGLVQASNYLDVYNEESGKIEHLAVEIGSKVSKGDTLLVLSDNDLDIQKSGQKSLIVEAKSNIGVAEANIYRTGLELTEAKKDYARTEKLFAAGAVSKSELEVIKTSVEKLESSWQEQKASLAQIDLQISSLEDTLQEIRSKEKGLVITSPIDGVVVRLPAKDGQFLMTGTSVAQVASLNEMEIKTELLSDDMADISVDQKAKIRAPLLKDTILEGKVVQIYPQAEEKLSALGVTQYRVPVIIMLKNHDKLRPGYEVKVQIETLSKTDVIIIPRETIIHGDNDSKQVMVIEDGRVKYVDVETGLSDRVNIEIITGLEAEEEIVLDGSSLLKEGLKVKGIK